MAILILTGAEFSVSKGIWWELVISLAGGFLYFERPNALIFPLSTGTDMEVSSLLWGFGHDLETNKFTEVEVVEGHGVIALIVLDIVGGWWL